MSPSCNLTLSPEGEQLLHALVHHASDAVVVQDLESGLVVDANQQAELLYGYSRAEFQAFPKGWELRTEEQRAAGASLFELTTSSEPMPAQPRWHARKDGRPILVDVTATRVEVDGHLLFVATMRDVSERLATQRSLEARLDEVESLLALSTLLSTTDDVSTVLDRVVEAAAHIAGATAAALGLRDGDSTLFEGALHGGHWQRMRVRVPFEGTASGQVMRTGKTLLVEDPASDPRVSPIFAVGMPSRPVALAPVPGRDGLVRAVLVVGERSDDRPFTPRDVALLEAAARHAGVALERAQAQREREQMLEETRQRARTVQQLLDLTAALNAADTPDEVVRELARHAAMICNTEEASVALAQGDAMQITEIRRDGGWGSKEYRPPASGSITTRVLETGEPYISNDLSTDPYTDHQSDAEENFRNQLTVPLPGPGGRAAGTVTLFNKLDGPFIKTDQTMLMALAAQAAIALERTRTRTALAEAVDALQRGEQRFRSLVQNVSDIITIFDTDGTIHYQSPAVERVLGYRADELTHALFPDMVHPEDLERLEDTYRAVVEQGGSQPPVQARFRHRDGSWRTLEVVFTNLLDDASVQAMVVVSRDVTERMHSEEGRRFLAEAGAVLSSSLEYEATLAGVVQMIVPRLADWCSVYMRGEDGRPRRLLSYYADPEKERLARAMQTRFPAAPGRSRGVAEVIESGVSEFMPEASEAERSTLAPEHQQMLRELGARSRIIVPLVAHGETLGALSLGTAESGRTYGPDDLALLEEVGRRAGMAVENARLYRELAERKTELQSLVGRLIAAQEEERRRVAYEVHDGLAQVAAATHQHLQAFAHRYHPRRPQAREELSRSLELAQRSVREARRVVAGLRPTVLDDFGLATALRHEAETLRGEGWEVTFSQSLGAARLPATVETALFRVAQEAITNARKHAGPTNLSLLLERRGDGVALEVQDWGRGFDPTSPRANGEPGERMGLSGMQERVALLGGRLEVRSRPGRGTHVVVEVPVGE